VNIKATPHINGENREGHFHFIVWRNRIEDSAGTGNVSGWGGLFNFDQEITDNFSIFARIGGGDGSVSPATFSLSTGFGVEEPFGLKRHNAGLAFSWDRMSTLNRTNLAGLPVTGDRYMIEGYWRVHLTKTLHVGPVVQWIRDDDIGLGDTIVWGFRTTWVF